MFDTIGGIFGILSAELSNGIWDTLLQWMYITIYDTIAELFMHMGNLGVEIFDLEWVQATVQLFYFLGWALFAAGLVVAIFDTAVEADTGRVNIKTTAMNILKGFLAVSLFTVVPLELYKFCVTLQHTFAGDLTQIFAGHQTLGMSGEGMSILEGSFRVGSEVNITVFNLAAMIAMAYCIMKVFFANLKRGGILLIQMAVGSLYMFSVPRGYADGFTQWCKQIVALCLTSFLQTTLLFMGLITFTDNWFLGLGIMLSANEVPRIAQQFGLDTTAKFNVMSAVHATTTAVNLTRSVGKAVGK